MGCVRVLSGRFVVHPQPPQAHTPPSAHARLRLLLPLVVVVSLVGLNPRSCLLDPLSSVCSRGAPHEWGGDGEERRLGALSFRVGVEHVREVEAVEAGGGGLFENG